MADGDRSWEDWEVVELQENWDAEVTELRDRLAAAEARVEALTEALRRATYLAEHLFQMTDRETWLATGGDDGQGHYEGDYRAEQLLQELRSLAALAAALPERQEEK